MASGRRIGIFGGSFNPPHLGHLIVAEAAREAADLDLVFWMPAGSPPHKNEEVLAAEHRLAMVREAVAGNEHFLVRDDEVRREGPSYTVETLKALQAELLGDELFLLVGADMFAAFSTWRQPEIIRGIATVLVYPRPEFDPARDESGDGTVWIDAPMVDISSTRLRARVARETSIRYLVPEGVRRYISRHGLYRAE
ncbi:nicotinate (nicotinamide) nucleotide adenylyltransferase [soil metagenome]